LRTPIEKGVEIIAGMHGHTSGMAIPAFIVDLPDGGGKVPLLPDYVAAINPGSYLFKNCRGNLYSYRNPSDGSNVNNMNSGAGEEHLLASALPGVEA
ncbi:MAG: hypothetical protein PHT28_04195, partial [Dehalococcoidales bacterium]|nr:hypothetical protein [Dehalococcoidales bacterium]